MLKFAGANMAFCTPGRLKSTIGKVIFLDVMPIRIFVSKFGCFSDRGILIPIKILEEFQGHFILLFKTVYQETRKTSSIDTI